jgi:uncharacterized protein
MRNGHKIVDADTHHREPEWIWEKYIEDRYKAAAPRMGTASSGRRTLLVEGESTRAEEGKYLFNSKEFLQAAAKAMERFDRAKKMDWNPQSRILDMDEEGVDIQIIYPTEGGHILGKEFRDTELLAACCRAYNDWSAEFCSFAPDRLKFSAILPIQDPEKAIVEAHRTAKMGATSFFMRPNPVLGRNLYHKDYWPLWAEIEKLDKPVSIHDAASPRLPSFGERMDTHTSGHILSHPFEAMATMAGLIWFGVPEQFPRLTIVHVEADGGWVPYWLQRMEQHFEFSGNAEHPELKMQPSKYFYRNFFVACRGDERTLKSVVELCGDNNFLWNTDYPHPDGTWPTALRKLYEQPIPAESKRKILWDNPARAFHLN